jgi:hypothetical protein
MRRASETNPGKYGEDYYASKCNLRSSDYSYHGAHPQAQAKEPSLPSKRIFP